MQSIKANLIELKIFTERLLKSPISSIENVILTPPGSKKCFVLNKKTKKIETFRTQNPIDHWTISQVFIDQDYDLKNLKRFNDLAAIFNRRNRDNRKNLIVDAGANIGVSARYLATEWPDSDIWLIEPSLRNIEIANCNKRTGMRIIHAALGPNDGHCVITNSYDNPNAFRTAACSSQEPESCPMLSMQSILKEAYKNKLHPWILKVDIEGAERDVFKGASAWLSHWPVLMIELHDWMLPCSAASAPVLEAIAATGRDTIFKGNTLISIGNPLPA